MQNLDDVFKLLREAESAVRRSGWKGGDCSRHLIDKLNTEEA